MEQSFEKVSNNLIRNLKNEEINVYPIKRHPLLNYDINIQEMYICLLCILTNINNNVNYTQQSFLKRILIGIDNNNQLIDFYKKAVEIDQDFVPNLAKNFSDSDLKYSLIVDMLILLGMADNQDEMQTELVSEIALVLKLDLQTVENCISIAKSILEQNERIILDMVDNPNNLLKNFICYITEYYAGTISFNDSLIYGVADPDKKLSFTSLIRYDEHIEEPKDIFASLPISFDQEIEKKAKKSISLTSETAIFENYILANEDLQIIVENCHEVRFVNCEFDRLRITPLVISDCNSVTFENCTFKNISSEIMVLVECTDLVIKNCEFNFITVPNIIRFNTLDNLLIENSLFVKISFKQLSEAIISVTEWPDSFIVRSNTFINCKNTSGFGSLLLYSTTKLNENINILIDKNEFVNCFASVILNCQYLEPKHYSNNKIDNNTKLR